MQQQPRDKKRVVVVVVVVVVFRELDRRHRERVYVMEKLDSAVRDEFHKTAPACMHVCMYVCMYVCIHVFDSYSDNVPFVRHNITVCTMIT